MDVLEYLIEFVPNYEKHILRVFLGEERLSEIYEPHVVRNAHDHTRHAAMFEPARFKRLMATTTVSSGKSPASDHTWATRKKRRP